MGTLALIVSIVGGLAAFVAFWIAISALIARLSGWRAMAARHPCPPGLQGTSLPTGWGVYVGIFGYRGAIRFEGAPAGLLVRVLPLFPFHAPLLLPWSALRLGPGNLFFCTMEVLDGATFRISQRAHDAIVASQTRALSRG